MKEKTKWEAVRQWCSHSFCGYCEAPYRFPYESSLECSHKNCPLPKWARLIIREPETYRVLFNYFKEHCSQLLSNNSCLSRSTVETNVMCSRDDCPALESFANYRSKNDYYPYYFDPVDGKTTFICRSCKKEYSVYEAHSCSNLLRFQIKKEN